MSGLMCLLAMPKKSAILLSLRLDILKRLIDFTVDLFDGHDIITDCLYFWFCHI